MDDLKREASKHFAEGLKLNKDNYLELSHMADKYNAKELLEKCAKYIMLEGKEDDIDWEEVSKLLNLMLESMKVAKKGGNFPEDEECCLHSTGQPQCLQEVQLLKQQVQLQELRPLSCL